MRTSKCGFTIHIDGIIMHQVESRRHFTGRSLSGEIGHLLQKALASNPEDEELFIGCPDEHPFRTSISLDETLLMTLKMKARDMHIPCGRLINLLLKHLLETQAKSHSKLMAEMVQRGQPEPPQ